VTELEQTFTKRTPLHRSTWCNESCLLVHIVKHL
jgi:hypothetical protein